MAWQKITVNVQNVQTETQKAVLITMPHSSDYDGFPMWERFTQKARGYFLSIPPSVIRWALKRAA